MRNKAFLFFSLVMFAAVLVSGAVAQEPLPSTGKGATMLAATPPMGWNSWDGYGTTVNEANFKANANWLATHLKDFGWQYVVVDMEWFVTNPIPEGNSKNFQYQLDQYGRYVPAPDRFPSATGTAGFRPLADYVHSLGLKFGMHILRGIPKQAVEKNLPVERTEFRAADAALQSDTCPWNFDNFGVDPSKPAGQAYYDSIGRLYAAWEVDLIKVDCIASHPYKGEEIRMLSEALRKTGRPIALSLSPGAAPLDKAEEMARSAQMWRISDDIWDLWHSTVAYPQGLGDQFANAQKWVGIGGPGAWPDADMLPLGFLGPAPGWGKPRQTRLSHDEQRTLMTLWCIFPSPLMVGGDLTKADEWTTWLLTNREALNVDQHSTGNRVAVSNDEVTIWIAEAKEDPETYYVAAFNRSESSQSREFAWEELGLSEPRYRLRDLWEHKELGQAAKLSISLAPHASLLYSLKMVGGGKP